MITELAQAPAPAPARELAQEPAQEPAPNSCHLLKKT